MPSENAKLREKVVLSELEDEGKLIATIVAAHKETCNYTKDISQRTKEHPLFTTQLECPLHSSAPIADNGNQRLRVDFSERFSPAIKEVVDFARRIPGFEQLSQNDQVTLLKAGVFEVLLVRLMYMFDTLTNTMLCLNGQMIKRESLQHTYNSQFLLDSLFEFADQLKILQLLDSELGLFCAVVVFASDRPGLHNVGFVEKIQEKLRLALKNNIANGHSKSQHLFQELMQKIPILRTLNKLHSEKLLPFKMKADSKTVSEIMKENAQLSQFDHTNPFSIKNCKLPEANKYTAHARSENFDFLKSNEEFFKRQTEEALLTYSAKNPLPLCNDEVALVVSNATYVNKERKLDSPTDSGIESGRELGTIDGSCGSQSGSMCSSPRSSIDEKIKEVSSNEVQAKQESIEDMPVLKRALQAPPLNNANLLMNEAYKPHKKFRALRNSSPSGSDSTPSSTTNSVVTSSTNNCNSYYSLYNPMSLAKSHSTLVKTLSQGPQMTEQQLKCTDIIHNIIMNDEQASKYHSLVRSPHLPHEAESLNCPSSSVSGKGRYFGQYIPPPSLYNRGMAYSEGSHYQSAPPQVTPPLKHSHHAHSSFNNDQPNSSNVISSYHHHHRHLQAQNYANGSFSKRENHHYSPGGTALTPTLATVLQLPTVSNVAYNERNGKIYGGKNATSTKISIKSSAEANICSKIRLNYHLPQAVPSNNCLPDCQPLNLSKKITSNHLSNGHHSHISTTTHKGHSSTSSQKMKMKVI